MRRAQRPRLKHQAHDVQRVVFHADLRPRPLQQIALLLVRARDAVHVLPRVIAVIGGTLLYAADNVRAYPGSFGSSAFHMLKEAPGYPADNPPGETGASDKA